ncbi:MAG: PAS domain-containing sensor histidine kinase [Hyphomicrobiales bacterium]
MSTSRTVASDQERPEWGVPEGDSGWPQRATSIARIVAYSCDAATGFTLRSENSMEIMGLPSAGPTEAWSDLVLPEDLPYFENALRSITPQAPQFEIEYRVRHTVTGVRFWVLDRGEGEFDKSGNRLRVRGAIIDISARISAETEMRQAARLSSVAFEASRMGAWHLDVTANRLTCSDELLMLLGIDRGQFDGTPHAIEKIIHPDDVKQWREAFERALRRGGGMELEFRMLRPRGNLRWFLWRGEILRRPDGAAIECHGVMIDITERKTAEEGAARLAAIVASSEDAIISNALNGIVTSWNRGAERLLGYSADEIIGQPIFRIIPPDRAGEELRILSTIRSGESIAPYESIRLRKDGGRLDVSLSVSPIRNAAGQVAGASTIARDITERLRHVDSLRQNEARIRLALRSARAGAWDYDLVRKELHWSPEMFDLYGLDAANGVPARKHLSARIEASHRHRVRAEFAKALAQGGAFTLEFPIVRPDGSEIWTAVVGDVIKDAAGRAVSARGIDQDITERKNWETRQAMLLRELSHRVKNTLAVIQSMTRQTLRASNDPRGFVEAFEGRIRSLASSHNLLTEANWSGARLADVIRNQLGGMVDDMAKRLTLRGPDVLLAADTATQLGLVLHELGTNAAKYGALSTPAGTIAIVWIASRGKLSLVWRERGGPRIDARPAYEGFGTALLISSAGKVKRRFDSEGLTCRLDLAL